VAVGCREWEGELTCANKGAGTRPRAHPLYTHDPPSVSTPPNAHTARLIRGEQPVQGERAVRPRPTRGTRGGSSCAALRRECRRLHQHQRLKRRAERMEKRSRSRKPACEQPRARPREGTGSCGRARCKTTRSARQPTCPKRLVVAMGERRGTREVSEPRQTAPSQWAVASSSASAHRTAARHPLRSDGRPSARRNVPGAGHKIPGTAV